MASPQRWDDMAAKDRRSPSPSKKARKPTAAGEAKRIKQLLKGGTVERREAFAALTEHAKAPGGVVVLEEEFEVAAGKIMLPCVHPLLAVLSEPAKLVPQSVSGEVSVLVDGKMAKAVQSARAAETYEDLAEQESADFGVIIKSLKGGPKTQAVHDGVKDTWSPATLSAEEWRILAAAIVSQRDGLRDGIRWQSSPPVRIYRVQLACEGETMFRG